MSWIELSILVAATATLATIPSSSVALVVYRASTFGLSSGVAAALGIAVADLIFAFMALAGLAAIAEALGAMFAITRYVAGAYLIWLGISLMRNRKSAPTGTSRRNTTGVATSFAMGIGLTMGDIKAIVFYAAFFPSIVEITALGTADFAMIGMATFATVASVKVGYAILGRKVAIRVAGLPLAPAIRMAAGAGLAGLGALIIIKN